MVPTSFDESNGFLSKPPDMTDDQCSPLSIWRGLNSDDLPVVISCWKMTPEELEEVKQTGRVWLLILGVTMPPAALAGNNPFRP